MTTKTELTAWILHEQDALWADLGTAIRSALNGHWSIECSNVSVRILAAAELVGPSPWQGLPWNLVAGGVYEALLGAGGITPVMPTDEEWQRVEPMMAPHGGTRTEATAALADTVAALRADRDILHGCRTCGGDDWWHTADCRRAPCTAESPQGWHCTLRVHAGLHRPAVGEPFA